MWRLQNPNELADLIAVCMCREGNVICKKNKTELLGKRFANKENEAKREQRSSSIMWIGARKIRNIITAELAKAVARTVSQTKQRKQR